MVSTMGSDGTPGASLRAWRDFLPRAQIFGADYDAGILFAEERIATHFADQLDAASLEAMYAAFGAEPFDVVIDDGLHSNVANLNVLAFGVDHCKPGGYIVIEDISHARVGFFSIVKNLLAPRGVDMQLVRLLPPCDDRRGCAWSQAYALIA